MREIKFRAWDKVTKKIYPVSSLAFTGNGNLDRVIIFNGRPLESGESIRVPDEVVLIQYTGLKDKNGKEIYEGDIVRLCLAHYPWIYEEKGEKPPLNHASICTIEVENLTPYVVEDDDDVWPLFWIFNEIKCGHASIEVIGNIYENPELLKEAEK